MMKIGIMGAMLEEVEFIKRSMQIAIEETIADRTYYSGRLHDIETVLVFSRWGKVAAASTATTLINNHGVNLIIFTGVAGAVDPALNIGDVVIGEALYQHDMDARPFFSRFQIPLTENALFRPDPSYVDSADRATAMFLGDIKSRILATTLTKFSILSPQVYRGIIASGDKFISDAASHDALKLESEKVLAVEMEGAAVAQVCDEHDVSYVIVRTISDKADHSAEIDFQAFVREVASHYSEEIVREFYRTIFLYTKTLMFDKKK